MPESSLAPWTSVWITGASTGIGHELAIRLAERGVRVAVSARSEDKLRELAAQHPGIIPFPVDVTDREAVLRAYRSIHNAIGPIELAILNAGVWDPMSATTFNAERIAATMNVNYSGIVNALEPLLQEMIGRRGGHLALVASIAGYRGLPKAVAYAPSKAAVISLAETLRIDLAPHDVTVSLINPGFVETPMTSVNRFPMPFIMSSSDAAERILAGLEKKRFEIAFPWQLVSVLKLLRVLPYPVYYAIARRLAGRV